MPGDAFPVEWMGRRATVAFPEHVDVSNVGQLRDRLLSVINRGATVLIADMTETGSCDHSAIDAIARAYQRAVVNGIEGLDRLVAIYPSLEAATAAGMPASSVVAPSAATPQVDSRPPRGLGGMPGAGGITPALLWQLIDALGDGLALTGDDGKIVLVNRRCAEMFGYQRGELTGLTVDMLVPSDVRAAHKGYRAGYEQAPLARPMGERARLAGLRKDGATFPVEISLSPVPTATENFVLAVIRDATEARQRDDLAGLARRAVADQSHLTMDLLDRVVHRLLKVGLSLQSAPTLPGDVARARLTEELDELDDTIHEIRDFAFTSGEEGP
jgi:PAS domain S-box-containing protein